MSVLSRVGLPAALVLCCAPWVLAQSQQEGLLLPSEPSAVQDDADAAPVSSSGETLAPAYVPLDLKQKYLYSVNEIFGVGHLVAVAVHAGLDQAGVRPTQWGDSPQSFLTRSASHFGDLLVRQSVAFGIRALDHEDPRYFRLGRGSGWQRTRYAFVHTFVARNDEGRSMPAYSQILVDYGMPWVVREWRPERYHTFNTIEAGSLAIGVNMGTNMFAEFWPDIKKKLPASVKRGPLARALDSGYH